MPSFTLSIQFSNKAGYYGVAVVDYSAGDVYAGVSVQPLGHPSSPLSAASPDC